MLCVVLVFSFCFLMLSVLFLRIGCDTNKCIGHSECKSVPSSVVDNKESKTSQVRVKSGSGSGFGLWLWVRVRVLAVPCHVSSPFFLCVGPAG